MPFWISDMGRCSSYTRFLFALLWFPAITSPTFLQTSSKCMCIEVMAANFSADVMVFVSLVHFTSDEHVLCPELSFRTGRSTSQFAKVLVPVLAAGWSAGCRNTSHTGKQFWEATWMQSWGARAVHAISVSDAVSLLAVFVWCLCVHNGASTWEAVEEETLHTGFQLLGTCVTSEVGQLSQKQNTTPDYSCMLCTYTNKFDHIFICNSKIQWQTPHSIWPGQPNIIHGFSWNWGIDAEWQA